MSEKIIVTGAAGFIGFHLINRLLDEGREVIGVDNLHPYYDSSLTLARLAKLREKERFSFFKVAMEDKEGIEEVFAAHTPDQVVHLAAQVGVRYSIEDPMAYVNSNMVGFSNILELCRRGGVKHLVYASSSSVYGANGIYPFSEDHRVDHPVSIYAATKKSNELMAHSYASLFNLPVTGLRFFTVYGPWGRPDMAIFKFTKSILNGDPIKVYNEGRMRRDFTYVDDIIEGVRKVMSAPPVGKADWNNEHPEAGASYAPYRVYNIGNNRSVPLMKMIETLEQALGKEAVKIMEPMQPGDMKETSANIDSINSDFGFEPKTVIEAGIPRFVEWYREYYRV